MVDIENCIPNIDQSPSPETMNRNGISNGSSSSAYDRTWPLKITIEYPNKDGEQVELRDNPIEIRVRGDYTVGNVIYKISEITGPNPAWSDYVLWWPKCKKWLKQFGRTLDQEDVIAHTNLHFTSKYKMLQIQLPDLTITTFRVDFSVNILNVTNQLCNVMQISHSEEFSLMRPLTKNQLKKNNPNLETSPLQRPYGTLSKTSSNSFLGSDTDTIYNGYHLHPTINGNGTIMKNGTISSSSSMNGSSNSLATLEQRHILLPHPKTAEQKARLNAAWLNSSISLYQQDVCENDLLMLMVKYYSFENLNADQLSRVNYIYEHLKNKVLREEITCTEDEMYTLAGIMMQVNIRSGHIPHTNSNGIITNNNNNVYSTQKSHDSSISNHSQRSNGLNGNGYNGTHHYANLDVPDSNGGQYHLNNGHARLLHVQTSTSTASDEVDSALESLERDLQGTSLHSKDFNGYGPNNGFQEQQLVAKLKISCQKVKTSTSTLARTFKFVGHSEKQYYVLLRDLALKVFRIQDFDEDLLVSHNGEPPLFDIHLTKCEVKADALPSQSRYCFKIIDSAPKDTMEYLIRCPDDKHYAQWYEACKLASRGCSITHSLYPERCQETLKRLQIQSKLGQNNFNKKDLKNLNFDPSQFIAPRFLKRRSKEQLMAKIKAAHEAFQSYSPVKAQMEFIETCQTLKDFGITLFVVRIYKSKIIKDMLGVMPDRLVLIDLSSGALKKCWRYKTMIDWKINWDAKRMTINFKDETLEFECLSADCKVIHEFIGGYIYMSMRGQNPNSGFNEEQFLKLTGGWNDEIDDDEEQNLPARQNGVRFTQTDEWA